MTLLEDQTRTPASTAMPETTRQERQKMPPRGLHGPARTYPTGRDCLLILDREPAEADWCRARASTFSCNRRALHQGRHAFVIWDLGGRVRAVWGSRAQAGEMS